jgi:hypothetical protein
MASIVPPPSQHDFPANAEEDRGSGCDDSHDDANDDAGIETTLLNSRWQSNNTTT